MVEKQLYNEKRDKAGNLVSRTKVSPIVSVETIYMKDGSTYQNHIDERDALVDEQIANMQSAEESRSVAENERQKNESDRNEEFNSSQASRETRFNEALQSQEQSFSTMVEGLRSEFNASEQSRNATFESKEAARDAAVAEATKVAETVTDLALNFDNVNNKIDGNIINLTPSDLTLTREVYALELGNIVKTTVDRDNYISEEFGVNEGEVIHCYNFRQAYGNIPFLIAFDSKDNVIKDACIAADNTKWVSFDYTVPNSIAKVLFQVTIPQGGSSVFSVKKEGIIGIRTELKKLNDVVDEHKEQTDGSIQEIHDVIGKLGNHIDSAINNVKNEIEGHFVNLSNDDLVVTGEDNVYYGSSTGVIYKNGNRKISKYITVTAGDTFDFTLRNTSNVLRIVAFDNDGNVNYDSSDYYTKDGSSSHSGVYSVPEGVARLQFCAQDVADNSVVLRDSKKGLIERVNDLESREESDEVNTIKISDFSGFKTNSDWSISSDKKSASTNVLNSILKYNNDTFEDEFVLCAKITPFGNDFEVAIGKTYVTTGYTSTLMAIKKSASGITLETYTNTNTTEPSVFASKNSIALTNVNIVSGHAFWIRIEKITDKKSIFNVEVIDEYGNADVITNIGGDGGSGGSGEASGSVCGYAWGWLSVVMMSGTSMKVEDLIFGYPSSKEIKCLILGHSYVEGNSISTDKDKRFASLIKNDIDTEICGHGGESTIYFKGHYLNTFVNWFKNAEYVIINLGANDINRYIDNPEMWASRVSTFKENCTIITEAFESVGVKVVWLTNNWWALNGKPSVDNVNSWMKENLPRVIDINKCFEDTNGNIIEGRFLADKIHPTIETHRRIYNCIKAQAPYLFG